MDWVKVFSQYARISISVKLTRNLLLGIFFKHSSSAERERIGIFIGATLCLWRMVERLCVQVRMVEPAAATAAAADLSATHYVAATSGNITSPTVLGSTISREKGFAVGTTGTGTGSGNGSREVLESTGNGYSDLQGLSAPTSISGDKDRETPGTVRKKSSVAISAALMTVTAAAKAKAAAATAASTMLTTPTTTLKTVDLGSLDCSSGLRGLLLPKNVLAAVNEIFADW